MLNDKTAIITGGANGIGKATAIKFMENGAKVIIWDLDKEKAQSFINEAKAKEWPLEFNHLDITDLNSVQAAVEKVIGDHGHVDILINNAGITMDASLAKMTAEQWQKVIDVNLTGVFNCTKAVMPFMKANSFGRIINASSVVGLYGNFGQTNYVATKAGVIGMTKVWARELGKYNITVNAVAPGFIKTEMIENVPEKLIDMMKDRSAVKRLGEVDDIANAYLFLSSDLASFISGATLSVDGGLVI
jgi:3-oxoacyl-[acyl-carrier protein] reductase